METASLEIREVILPEDVASLRSEMYSKINEALAWGVFTEEEANDWRAGFEACDRIEYMDNLIDIVDDFVASGFRVINQIEESLKSDLLNQGDKMTFQQEADSLNFHSKQLLADQLSTLLGTLGRKKDRLLQILEAKDVTRPQRNQLVKEFETESVQGKDKVIAKADASEQIISFPESAAEDKQQEIIDKINDCISGGRLISARQLLVSQELSFFNYLGLEARIKEAEIAQTREELLAA